MINMPISLDYLIDVLKNQDDNFEVKCNYYLNKINLVVKIKTRDRKILISLYEANGKLNLSRDIFDKEYKQVENFTNTVYEGNVEFELCIKKVKKIVQICSDKNEVSELWTKAKNIK